MTNTSFSSLPELTRIKKVLTQVNEAQNWYWTLTDRKDKQLTGLSKHQYSNFALTQ